MTYLSRGCFFLGLSLAIVQDATPVGAQDKAPALELVEPAPGCPVKVPTMESLAAYCEKRDPQACKAEGRCDWLKASKDGDGSQIAAHCGPRVGAYLAPSSMEPSVVPNSLLAIALESLAPTAAPAAAKLADRANDAAASKQYDSAVSLYTQAVKADPLYGDFHIRRGLVLEYKGERTKALADYCDALVKGVEWKPQELAEERIKQLTQPDRARTPLPKFMRTGVLRIRKRSPPLAPLKIETPASADYILKLVNLQDDAEEMLIYVRANSSFETKVPLGNYKIRGASGTAWYGDAELFGEDTSFFRLAEKDDVDDEFKFVRRGNQVTGYRLKLVKQEDGNLESKPIDRKDF